MAIRMFKTRADAILRNSDAAADALRQAADAQARGDTEAVASHLEWAASCDRAATGFANGDYDDLIERP